MWPLQGPRLWDEEPHAPSGEAVIPPR
jgi:hypothetical protein